MKIQYKLITTVSILFAGSSLLAQNPNLVMNGSFENTSARVNSYGDILLADSVSSSNNTSVDLFSSKACGKYYGVPSNFMGSQAGKEGNNYAGIIAYYGDERGVLKNMPGYQKYSEYIQLQFSEPLVAGKSYSISFNASLAEQSAFAVSGMGIYFSKEKTEVKNNSFLKITPHVVCADIINNPEWSTISGLYVAKGGERFMTLGCFDTYMNIKKVIGENTNNSRKAYYYIDEVGVIPVTIPTEDIASILAGTCYRMNNLNFETDKALILETSNDELKAVSRFLNTYPYLVVYIDGYTDKTGTDQHNDKLSEERAKSVRDFLIKEGVNGARLKARGYGESYPIDQLNDKSSTNRRVEITICATEDSKAKVL